MDLSVIIVCYRGWKRLTRCLEALDSYSGKKFTMEVIMVDNNSGDDNYGRIEARFNRFHFMRNKINGGYSNGCNTGAAIARGEFILILNPDTIAYEAEVEKLLNAARSNPSYYILSCRQIRENGKESKATGLFPGHFRINNSIKETESVIFPDWVSGSVMMIRREIYEKLNGFDEDFWMYSEDVDLCRRARNMGGEIAFYRDITVEHNHGGSTRIDLKTISIAKCEVQISRHVYIHKHMKGFSKLLLHLLIMTDNFIIGITTGLAGLIFFFIPKLKVRLLLFSELVTYYSGVFMKRSWLSPRSVNVRK